MFLGVGWETHLMKEKRFKTLLSILKRDDIDAVWAFLKTFPSISEEEVLAQAAEAGAKSAVRELLKFGTNPNHHFPTALVLAIESGCHEVFDDLLEAGADLGTDPWWVIIPCPPLPRWRIRYL